MSIITSPCRGCQNRKLLCHSDCSKYINFKDELGRQKESILKQKSLNCACCNYIVEKTFKYKKKYGYI